MAPKKRGKNRKQQETRQAEKLRSNKPQVERRRRQRINTCLDQLKTLVLKATHKESIDPAKMEKADILEMTVDHLQNLTVGHKKDKTEVSPSEELMETEYRNGFTQCIQEVSKYLHQFPEPHSSVASRLLQHIQSQLQQVATFSSDHSGSDSNKSEQDFSRPLHIEIPSPPPQTGSDITPDKTPEGDCSQRHRTEDVTNGCAIQVYGALHIIPARLLPTHATLLIPIVPNENSKSKTCISPERGKEQPECEQCNSILPTKMWRPW